jgi:hypothetical protein
MKKERGMFLRAENTESGGGGGDPSPTVVQTPTTQAPVNATAMTPPKITVVNDGVSTVATQHGVGDQIRVTFPDNWKQGLEEALRNDPSMGPVNDIQTLAKNYVNAQKLIGKNKIVVPDQHATPEDWKNAFQKLGLPQKFEEYQFNVPKDASFDDGFLTELKKVAFQNNILPKQVEGLVSWYSEANKKALEGFQQKTETSRQHAVQELKKEWGEAYDRKVAMARHAIQSTGLGEQVFSWLDSTAMGDDPTLIKLLSSLGEKFKEDGIIGEPEATTVSSHALDEQIAEIQGNFEHPYYNRKHPNHLSAVQQMRQLMELKYNGQAG